MNAAPRQVLSDFQKSGLQRDVGVDPTTQTGFPMRSLHLAGILIAVVTLSGQGSQPASTATASQEIDQIIQRGCESAGVTPFGRCNDAEFLRRVWLDLAGRTPPAQAVEMLDTAKPLDRSEVVRTLLGSKEHATYWGTIWTEYLTDRRPFDQADYDARRLMLSLTDSLSRNERYDQIVSGLLSGQGVSDADGTVNFLLRYAADPAPLAGAVSQKFLGLSLQCAECHDHPHAKWKQTDFWGLAAHFSRLRRMTPSNPAEGENFTAIIERSTGELTIPNPGANPDSDEAPARIAFPQLPSRGRTDDTKPRRLSLIEWVIDPANPYFSRHVVNLLWERLLGGKLVPNLDAWPPETPTVESQILDRLADEFAGSSFDLQHLIQAIVLSDAYQRSSHRDSTEGESADPATVRKELAHWARFRIRPLSADQLHLSIAQALGYRFDDADYRLAQSTNEEFTYDLPVRSFGSTSLSLGRSLALYNGEHIRGAVEFGASAASRKFGPATSSAHLNWLFESLLARRPTAAELDLLLDLSGESGSQGGLEDVIWTLLNSTEFVTNH
jgi:hypothetical protein